MRQTVVYVTGGATNGSKTVCEDRCLVDSAGDVIMQCVPGQDSMAECARRMKAADAGSAPAKPAEPAPDNPSTPGEPPADNPPDGADASPEPEIFYNDTTMLAPTCTNTVASWSAR